MADDLRAPFLISFSRIVVSDLFPSDTPEKDAIEAAAHAAARAGVTIDALKASFYFDLTYGFAIRLREPGYAPWREACTDRSKCWFPNGSNLPEE